VDVHLFLRNNQEQIGGRRVKIGIRGFKGESEKGRYGQLAGPRNERGTNEDIEGVGSWGMVTSVPGIPNPGAGRSSGVEAEDWGEGRWHSKGSRER